MILKQVLLRHVPPVPSPRVKSPPVTRKYTVLQRGTHKLPQRRSVQLPMLNILTLKCKPCHLIQIMNFQIWKLPRWPYSSMSQKQVAFQKHADLKAQSASHISNPEPRKCAAKNKKQNVWKHLFSRTRNFHSQQLDYHMH